MISNQDLLNEISETCICPSCYGAIIPGDNNVLCQNCSKEYPIIEGIPDFLKENSLEDKVQELSKIYDNESERYQDSPKSCGYAGDTSHLSRLNILRKWLDYEQLKEKKILDIGCGTGLMTQALTDSNCVWGVDISMGLLQLARTKGLRTVTASAELLPFEDDHFDIVICVGVIPYYEKPDKIFSEICRVIKPGGEILVTSTTNSMLIKSVRYLKNLLGGTSQLVRLYSPKEITAYLASSGCEILDSSVAYGDRIASSVDGRIGLRFRIFSRVAAALATLPE